MALLEKFDTLDNIYANLDKVENRWKGKFETNKEMAYMSRDLARIETNLKIKFDFEHAKVTPFHGSKLEAFFKEMEFSTLISKVPAISGNAPSAESAPATTVKTGKTRAGQMTMFANDPQPVIMEIKPANIDVIIVDSDEKLKSLVKELDQAKVISFDTETTGTEEMKAELVGISLAVKDGQGYYIPVGHQQGQQLPLEQVIAALRGPPTDPRIAKAAIASGRMASSARSSPGSCACSYPLTRAALKSCRGCSTPILLRASVSGRPRDVRWRCLRAGTPPRARGRRGVPTLSPQW